MPIKRFLSTAAPLALLALAGMGLATAQSSSPFAKKSRAQAWEQQPVTQTTSRPTSIFANQAPAWEPQTPAAQTPSVQTMSYEAPTQAPLRSFAPQISESADAPIATRPRRSTAMRSSSVSTPPKTFGGRAAQPAAKQYQGYSSQALAGPSLPPVSAPVRASTPPASTPRRGSDYTYTPPRPRSVAQAPNYGSPAPTPPLPPKQTSPYSAPPTSPPPSPTSGSPYAPRSGRRVQAWETQPQNTPAQPAPTYQNPTYQNPTSQNQGYQNQGYQNQGYQNQGYQSQPHQGQNYGTPAQSPPNGYTPNGYTPGYQSQVPPTGGPYSNGPYSGGPNAPVQPRSWSQRLGLDNIATLFRGKLTLGAAATNRDAPDDQFGPDDGWSDDQIADAELEVEVSAITDGGLEYGVALGGRAQYDQFRRGFGGRLPDCPAGTAGCSGTTAGLRGHTSGFYSTGEDLAKDAQVALESAHVFLRSAYGDVTIGRDDGSAYLFSLGAPTLLAVGASNSPVDYTGYDSVKTVNDASGFAEKITYTSPRLLGDQIGLGVQLGVSYALDGDVCGVDYCNSKNIDGIDQADIEDIFEVGLALDRTFSNGLRAELTGTYAHGSEKSGVAGLDDLDSYGAGLEFEYGDWTLGGSFLQSNNGLQDGDYTAYDAGLTWKPSALGFTLGYGYAEDDNVGLTSNQGTFGITYDFNKFTIGTGVQYVDREVNGVEAGIPTTLDQKATSIFVQGGFKF